MTWRYLRDDRHLPEAVISAAIRHDLLREGPSRSMWAAHRDGEGVVTGWEERGPEWRGFSTGGAKVLFRFGPCDALRLCVTEAAIDAMSLVPRLMGFRVIAMMKRSMPQRNISESNDASSTGIASLW